MSDGNDKTGGGGPGDGRREWPADYRIAFAELLVKFGELERDVMVSTADMKAYLAESRAAAARDRADADKRESRLVKWMAVLVGAATAILGAGMAALALFGIAGGN